MKLDLTSLNNAITALEKSVNSFNTLSTKDIVTDDDIQTLKAGVIQNFEVAYELCPDPWFEFGEKRNLSTHIYNMVRRNYRYKLRNNVDIAKEVFHSALLFVKEARSLQTNLEVFNEP